MRVHEDTSGRKPAMLERGAVGTDVRPAIRKIPPELRIRRIQYRKEADLRKRFLLRFRHDPQFFRSLVQGAFVLLCLWIGVEFFFFVEWGMSGGVAPYMPRPAGVEGFLPISALISLKYWLHTGIVNGIHPSGLFIFLAIVATGVIAKKGFCSWLCPIGTLSEGLWMLGKRLFGRNIHLPRWLDYPLRSLKYLLLAFFVWSIWNMDVSALKGFIYSPYNKVADIKMYLFFADIGGMALWTIIGLLILSVIVPNFWCRYLCPYGALLGGLSIFSPMKITRTEETCVDCALCTKACPARLQVHTARRVWSDECMGCLACVAACPVKNTLSMTASRRRPAPAWVYGTLIVGLFVGITGLAMLTGFWENSIPREEYLRRMQQIDAPVYQHFRGEVPAYGPND